MRRDTLLAIGVVILLLAALAAKSLLLSMPPLHSAAGEFDANRAKARLAAVLGDERAHPVDSAADHKGIGPLPAAEASELAEQLRLALAGLEDRHAQVFCLACLDGLSYQEIAEQLGVTVNHVGVLLNRAKATLRERLHAFAPAHSKREVQP